MSLKISSSLWTETAEVPEGASTRYFLVSSSLLSDPYKMKSGTHIKGKILEITGLPEPAKLPQLPVDAEFILQAGYLYDRIFLREKDWELNFREYGIVNVGVRVVVILESYIDEKNKLESIYSKVEKSA